MKKIKYLLSVLLFLFACQEGDIGDDIEIKTPVSIREVKPARIEEFVTTSGTVYAIKNTILRAGVEGRYRLVINPETGKTYGLGDRLRGGVTVIYLDNPEYENNIKVESLRLNLDISSREFEKQKSLYKKGGVTLRELKNAERTFIDARYAYDNALLQLAKLQIIASFDGIIINLPYYTPGTKIEVNQVMVELMDYSRLYTEVFYPANDLNRVKVGQELRVTHYSLEDDTLNGMVSQVAPALDPQTRAFKAHLLIQNERELLRPGMFVKVETVVAAKDSAIVIPREIVLSKRKGKTIFVVDKGAAFERIITTGLENENQVEVIEGLKKGERLVISGFETLRDRSEIKIVQ